MYLNYVFLICCSASLCSAFISLFKKEAGRAGLLDHPCSRKTHAAPVPAVGGISIFAVVLIFYLFETQKSPLLNWLIASSSILVFIGALDDWRGVSVRIRLCFQVVAAFMLTTGAGLSFDSLELGLSATDSLPPIVSTLLTVTFVIGMVNTFNMVDGIDGLAASHFLLSLFSISLLIYLSSGQIEDFPWLLVVGAAVVAFLVHNLGLVSLNRVFLGDAGSTLLGFMTAACVIYYGKSRLALVDLIALLWCVAIPIFDTAQVVTRRILAGRSPFSADHFHLHHLLINQGVSDRTTLGFILTVSALTSATGVFITLGAGSLISLMSFLCATGLYGVILCNPSMLGWLVLYLRLRNDSSVQN